MKFPRRSGVLLHPTSLPGRYGIGDLGDTAFRFVDWLAAAGQSYWQVLPLSPTGFGDSPYQTLSAFAGNPLLLNPDKLVEAGLLKAAEARPVSNSSVERVDYGAVIECKSGLLDQAYAKFKTFRKAQRAAFDRFCFEQASWLEEYALFMALKGKFELRPWYEWDDEFKMRKKRALTQARQELADEIQDQKFRQWLFFEQWLALKKYANAMGIKIIGDIPIFVSMDSADVWANPGLFQFTKALQPTAVSGVPPDYFSETGQLWGHPLYRWNVLAEERYGWWVARFRMALKQCDIVRIDHFRGFYNYWEVPAGAKTAVKGQWVMGPGADLFRTVTQAIGDVAIIAEDLGDFDADSRAGLDALQSEFGFPGMRVLQFGFGTDAGDHFLPHNFSQDSVVYTGTHDNDTTLGWYTESSTEAERDYARRYMGVTGADISWDLIRLAWACVANTALTTAQDLQSLGHGARMNTPSTVGPPNWCWRMTPDALSDFLGTRLRDLTTIYGRLPWA